MRILNYFLLETEKRREEKKKNKKKGAKIVYEKYEEPNSNQIPTQQSTESPPHYSELEGKTDGSWEGL